ncbi:membrane-spanning 4-domains subfamily A member 18-like isoform X1 [Ptychodera flava]|uniref:membrane-spanning 4-domains subfamily A member 18-like isoform X1 n=1 Tax=Ptychodera flava TaxID=63121 RepID=UPI00396A2112
MEYTDWKAGSQGQSQQQTTTATAVPQQTVVVQQTYGNNAPPNLAVKACNGLGIAQVVFGVILVAVAIVVIALVAYPSTTWNLIGCGIFFIITGALGISASRSKTTCLIVATMVCSILSILGGLSMIPGTVIALIWVVALGYVPWIVICVVILLVAVAEVIVAIIHSVVCCRAVCCCRQEQPSPTVYYSGHPYAANQPMAQGGQPYMANQPMASTGQVAYNPNQPAGTGQYYPQNQHVAPGSGEKGYY